MDLKALSLNQVTVRVRDFETSYAFYQRLGLIPIVRREDFYARFIVPGNEATFSIMRDDEVQSTTTINFEVRDVDATFEELKARGVSFKGEPIEQDWAWREAYFEDPDGHLLCIYSAGKHRMNPPWRLKKSMENHVLSPEQFDQWLTAYKAAWERRDPQAAAELFAEQAVYHETPYEQPMVGRDAILAYWKGVPDQQEDIHFRYEIISVFDNTGYCKWNTQFKRKKNNNKVQLNGMFEVRFNATGTCEVFREWWHSKEV